MKTLKKYTSNNLFSSEKEYEVTEEIYPNIYILQNNSYFKFGIDSFKLVDFFLANSTKKEKYIADFCSGTGIIGILSYIKLKENMKNVKVDFFEKQEYFADLNFRNISSFSDDLSVFNSDILEILEDGSFKDKYTHILINPPYMENGKGLNTNSEKKDIAKIASVNFLDNLFKVSKYCLIDHGELFLVTKPQNLIKICVLSEKYNIRLKKLQFICSGNNKPSLMLMKFVKNANSFLDILENLNI